MLQYFVRDKPLCFMANSSTLWSYLCDFGPHVSQSKPLPELLWGVKGHTNKNNGAWYAALHSRFPYASCYRAHFVTYQPEGHCNLKKYGPPSLSQGHRNLHCCCGDSFPRFVYGVFVHYNHIHKPICLTIAIFYLRCCKHLQNLQCWSCYFSTLPMSQPYRSCTFIHHSDGTNHHC